ncbi:hypothetical protein FHR71_004043 [Methylobacterium sp. RAS18]|nr:hypothetical protein [Methylobacterium sp. RAS18]
MVAKHTPGPWSAEGPDPFGDYNIHCPAERAVVATVISNLRLLEEVAANARLIAAAPLALKALLAVRDACRDPDTDTAMPRATGELVEAALAAMGERP